MDDDDDSRVVVRQVLQMKCHMATGASMAVADGVV